jgi:hypothetical protein|tara:strand:- start:122 stop:409 length:288 start_codon:yes stop_codon:yes gene_type:complete
MSNIGAVIGWKFDHQSGMCTYDGVITEFPNGVPSQSDQDLWTSEYEAHLASTEYSRQRKAAYDLLNQDEMRYDDLINSTTTWQDAIAAIKTEYPK